MPSLGLSRAGGPPAAFPAKAWPLSTVSRSLLKSTYITLYLENIQSQGWKGQIGSTSVKLTRGEQARACLPPGRKHEARAKGTAARHKKGKALWQDNYGDK